MFLGLRKNEGVLFEEFEKKLGLSMKAIYEKEIAGLVKEGLLIEDEKGVRLSRKGRFVGNEIFQQFLLGE